MFGPKSYSRTARLNRGKRCRRRLTDFPHLYQPNRMKIIQMTPGAGAMYCGNCLRDNALVAALRKLGHEALMLPMYLPLRLDEEDQSAGSPIFFSGINVYLGQKSALFRDA